MKVLHAPIEIAGNMHRICRYLRESGIDATAVKLYPDNWNFKTDIDRTLEFDNEDWIKFAIREYDIFHFHFCRSLRPDFSDLEEIKELGKPIIFSFWGSDQRPPEWILYHQAKFLGYKPPKPHMLNRSLLSLHKMADHYGDVLIGATCIPRGIMIPGYIDMAEWTLEARDRIRENPPFKKDPNYTYFVHAPSTHWTKGTKIIFDLLAQNKDLPIKPLLIQNMPLESAKQYYAMADFAIDQVGVGTFGLFGLECMAWDIPVLCYQTELYDRIRNDPPVIRTRKRNFRDKIGVLTYEPARKVLETYKLREWIQENADIKNAIPKYVEVYQKLHDGYDIPQNHNYSWRVAAEKIERGEKSEFYRFMIEEGALSEIMGSNNAAKYQYDKTLYH